MSYLFGILVVGGFLFFRWAFWIAVRLFGLTCIALAELGRIIFFPQRESYWDEFRRRPRA